VVLAQFGLEWADDGSTWRGTGQTTYADLPAEEGTCGVSNHVATWTGQGSFWSGSDTFDPLEDSGRISLSLDDIEMAGILGAFVLGEGWQTSYELVDCDEAGTVEHETESDSGVTLACPWDGGGLVGALSEDAATLDLTCTNESEDSGYTTLITVSGSLELTTE
jgi:hypothetical protein